MKFARSAVWVFSGLILVASGVYAQEAATQNVSSKTKASVKKPSDKSSKKKVAKKSAKPDARALQAQREAEARAKAEQEARQRAEAEQQARQRAEAEQQTRQRAEAEAGKQAELEVREKLLRDAEALMKNGKPADAYTLLEPLEFDRSGEVRFDYLLGIAALDSGKPDKATLAFERVLAVDANFAGARLDMARAYYQLGDLPRAKTEFETVLKQNPPEAARVTIQKYLEAIATAVQAKQTRISGYVEGTVGHDTNANSATSQTTIPVSGFSYTLSPDSRKTPDNYLGFAAGGEVSHSLNANWGVYAGIDLRRRGNMVQTIYDLLSTDGRAGVMYAEVQNAYKLTLTTGQAYTANTMRRDSVGASAEWLHTFSPSNQMNVFGQYGRYRGVGFPPSSPTTDARIEGNTDQVILGAGWVHVMADGKQALFGSVYAGKELDVAPVISAGLPNGGRRDGKKTFEGLRVGGQSAITEQMDVFASLGWQHAVYGNKPNSLVPNGDSRKEYLYDLSVGANWRVDKLWSVRPLVAISKKNSNAGVFAFDRTDVSLTVRRDFR